NADRSRLGAGSYGTLWDRNGNRLSGGTEKSQPKAQSDLARALAEVRGNVDFRTDTPEGSMLFGAQPVATQPWVYTAQQPESYALEGLNARTKFSLFVFLAAAISVVGVSFGLARLIALPLRDLQRVAGAIRFGDFSARVQVRTRDELGEVATSLNQMLDDVI